MAQAELGRLLAAAGGYRVLASDGTHLGCWITSATSGTLTTPTRSSSAVAAASRGGGQGGKIKESRHYFDSLTLLKQIGVQPK